MNFSGKVTAITPIQSGISRSSGKEWKKIEVVLEYQAHETYPKSIVFSVMNDKIGEFNFQVGGEYEVEVDFSSREYNGKFYLSANAWKATAKNVPTATAPQQAQTAQQPQGPDDDLPF